MSRTVVLFFCVFFLAPAFLRAEDSDLFKKYNPNGKKFEFARSYITSLGYLRGVETRWKKSNEVKKKDGEEKLVQWNIERMIMENMDARVAKSYMTKYFQVDSALMRKVVDSYVYVCDQLIELNRQEREKWEQLKGWKENWKSTYEKMP